MLRTVAKASVMPLTVANEFPLHSLDINGRLTLLPGAGGVYSELTLGSPAYGYLVDRAQPAVAVSSQEAKSRDYLQAFACLGNIVRVTTGRLAGMNGVVVGKNCLIEDRHLAVWFPEDVLTHLSLEDGFRVELFGRGLALTDYPDVMVHNIAPNMLRLLCLSAEQGKLEIKISAIVPRALVGAGVEFNDPWVHDLDIAGSDEAIENNKLSSLRLGDIVCFQDTHSINGRQFKRNALTFGVVSHTAGVAKGYGPGVTTFLTCCKDEVRAVLDAEANIGAIVAELVQGASNEK